MHIPELFPVWVFFGQDVGSDNRMILQHVRLCYFLGCVDGVDLYVPLSFTWQSTCGTVGPVDTLGDALQRLVPASGGGGGASSTDYARSRWVHHHF